MNARRLVLTLAGALGLAAALAPSAGARAYDVHIYRVAGVQLTGTFKLDIVPSGPGFTEHLTRTAKAGGKPGGSFRIGPTGRNVAFFRENVSSGGHIQAGPLTTTWTQTGAYQSTREVTVDNPDGTERKEVQTEESGNCDDRKTSRWSLEAGFKVRARKLVGSFGLPPQPTLKNCQGAEDHVADNLVTTPSGIARSRAYSARTLTFPIRFRKVSNRREDNAAVTQTTTWTGSVTLRRVKTCVFRRGNNQYACFRFNPDGL